MIKGVPEFMRRFFPALLVLLLAGCGGYPDELTIGEAGAAEPDRILFERALIDMNRGRHIQARLELNTLINTYSDSEFLPQSKYAIAESFYRDGGQSDLIQSEAEFRDYITFFPTSDLADDAQLMVALTHVRQMQKPDRDPTQALMAELELESFISTYPDSQLLDEAKDKLRAVKEVLADGILKVANFYSTTRSYVAAIDRYRELLEDYPDYSKTPETLYKLAEAMRINNNEGESIIYYARVVRDHPLSEEVEQAKIRLGELGQPIPEVNPVALARAEALPPPVSKGLFARMFGLLSRQPDVSAETTAASIIRDEGSDPATGEGDFEVEGVVVTPPTNPPPGSD